MTKVTRALIILVACVVGCGGSTPTPTPSSHASSPVTPSSGPASAPPASASPASGSSPSGALRFPSATGVVLAPGRYSSSPPFDIPFTFEVEGSTWQTGHLGAEFFDIQQFDEGTATTLPSRWIAFAHPTRIRGETDQDAGQLTAEEVASLWSERSDLTVGEPSPFTLDEREGLRMDIHADASNTKLFGGPGGDFGLGPEHDVRLGIVPLDGDLLLVLVLAPGDELDSAWDIAEPILASVAL